jgi:hypothetical protein
MKSTDTQAGFTLVTGKRPQVVVVRCGLSGACTNLQHKAGIRYNPMLQYAECMTIGEYRNNPRLLRLAVD